MNRLIRNYLVEIGFLGNEPEMDYNFDDQESYIYHVRNSADELITVKVAHNGLGYDEFNGQKKVWKCFPGFVAKPINYRKFGNQEFIFQECVQHHSFHARRIFSQRFVWSKDLPDFLFSKPEELLNNSRRSENDYEKLLELISDSLPENIYRMANNMLAKVELKNYRALPARAQHGDFSINNLGVRKGRLIIFDWENFDISYSYGLDYTVFVASALGHDASRIISHFGGSAYHCMEQLRQLLMKNTSLNAAGLIPLFLMCYTIFYSMKKKHGYADEIINKTGDVLDILYRHYGYN